MAHAPQRSMNSGLIEGATDGKYKKLRPDTQGIPGNDISTYETRRALSLPYYGYGEPRMVEVPGMGAYVEKPDQHANKFENREDYSVLGETW